MLVVDDNKEIVEVFTKFLARDGYQIKSTTNAHDALKLVEQFKPDVIVLDVIMPGLSGIEICRQIKSSDKTRLLPIVLVTGKTERSNRLAGIEAGADDLLTKPVDLVELTTRVRSLIRTKQLYEAVEQYNQELEQRVEARTSELREANQRLDELSKLKGRILNTIAHELRTPLGETKNALWLINQEDPPERMRDLVDRMNDSFRQLELKIDDISVYADPTELKRTPTSTADLIAGALGRVRQIRGRNIDDVELKVERNLPPIDVDSNRMTRVMANLIDNGLKYGSGKPVSVQAKRVDDGVYIAIHDNGPGISDEAKQIMFQLFRQGDESVKRRYGGIGLGLAMVKTILEAHHIELTYKSSPETGTTFMFTLPIATL